MVMLFKLKDRSVMPPNGIIVRIKKAKLEKQFWDFNQAVQWYVGFSSANPQLGLTTDPSTAAEIIDQQNAARVARIDGAGEYVRQVDGAVIQEAIASTAPAPKTCCGAKKK